MMSFNKLRSVPSRYWNLITVVLVLVLLVSRDPISFAHPMFWAEDGAIFFAGAFNSGVHSLFDTYAGYYQLLPRLTAWGASFLPMQWAPVIYLWTAVGLYLSSCLYFLWKYPGKERYCLVLWTLLLPSYGEVFSNITNVQWLTMPFYMGMLFQAEAPTRKSQVVDLVVLGFLGLSGPFIMLFAPFYLWRAWQYKNGHAILLVIVAAVLALLELVSVLHSQRITASGLFGDMLGSVALFSPRIFYAPFLAVVSNLSVIDAVAIVGMCFLIFCTASILCTIPKDKRILAFCAVWVYVLIIFLAVKVTPLFIEHHVHPASLEDRYFYIPGLMLGWLFFLGVFYSRVPWVSKGSVVLLVWMIVISVTHFPFSMRTHHNYHWLAQTQAIEHNGLTTIPINPHGWEIHLVAHS